MSNSDIFDTEVSFQNAVWDSKCTTIKISKFIDNVKNGEDKQNIIYLRDLIKNGEIEKYDAFKKRLNAITFSALFNENRKKENIKYYTELITIDIDNLDTDSINRYKKILNDEPIIISFWESPSQKGLKGIVRVKYKFEYRKDHIDKLHKIAFSILSDYLKSKYGILIDKSGSDFTRLCFTSYDPNLVFKENYELFEIDNNFEKNIAIIENINEIIGVKTDVDKIINSGKINENREINKPFHRKQIASIIKYLKKRNLTITDNYNNWYRVALAISNSFTFNIGEKYFLNLCRLDKEKHNEAESINMIRYCYANSKGKINYDTIFYLAQKKGYKNESSEDDIRLA